MNAMAKRLVKAYSKASEAERTQGAAWYTDARMKAHQMAERYGVSLECAAGCIAALSPRLHWSRNLTVAERCLAGQDVAGVFQVNLRKAERIRAGESPLSVLNGPKVRAFYQAILGDDSAAVVDVWVLRVVGWTKNVTRKVYERIAAALAQAAQAAGTSVCTLQAAVWVAIRGKAD